MILCDSKYCIVTVDLFVCFIGINKETKFRLVLQDASWTQFMKRHDMLSFFYPNMSYVVNDKTTENDNWFWKRIQRNHRCYINHGSILYRSRICIYTILYTLLFISDITIVSKALSWEYKGTIINRLVLSWCFSRLEDDMVIQLSFKLR